MLGSQIARGKGAQRARLATPSKKLGPERQLAAFSLFWRVSMPVDPWENAFQEKIRRLARGSKGGRPWGAGCGEWSP